MVTTEFLIPPLQSQALLTVVLGSPLQRWTRIVVCVAGAAGGLWMVLDFRFSFERKFGFVILVM
ncbi:hypothetical protein E2C01_021765 [Portunus trituberculatus]|uniref:Uncharacterized protein n=1 Tax=Portunus trituberculatus TaxID=210409 RepID=A0A5B7E5S6_PORTR|nr:hypothetical protein [Portunus trituberculatus]